MQPNRNSKVSLAALEPHHVAAAERFERLVQRAQMVPRVTMSYDPTAVRRSGAGNNGGEAASDTAAEARQRLNKLAAGIPGECWGVLFDVCALGKGLQLIETERRWPRRSAKLVLRIALEQLAGQFGLSPQARGGDASRPSGWMEQRLPIVPKRLGDQQDQ